MRSKSSYVTEVMRHFILLYALKVLSNQSDIGEEGEACCLTKLYVKRLCSTCDPICQQVWEVPERPRLMHTFPPQILYYLSILFGNGKLIQMTRLTPANQWIGTWRARLNMYAVGSLLSVQSGAAGISLRKSAITHKYPGQGMLVRLPMEGGEVAGYYYRSFVESDFRGQKQMKKM